MVAGSFFWFQSIKILFGLVFSVSVAAGIGKHKND